MSKLKHYVIKAESGRIFSGRQLARAPGEILSPEKKRLEIDVRPDRGNVKIAFSFGIEDISMEPLKAMEFARVIFALANQLQAKRPKIILPMKKK